MKKKAHQELYDKAHKAGMEAASATVPTPMTVVQRSNPFDDNSPVVQTFHVSQGVCGFAWVNVKPGNSSFARWLKTHSHCQKAYEGGVNIWVRDFDQSYELKMAYARAFANVLSQAGIRAYGQGRLD